MATAIFAFLLALAAFVDPSPRSVLVAGLLLWLLLRVRSLEEKVKRLSAPETSARAPAPVTLRSTAPSQVGPAATPSAPSAVPVQPAVLPLPTPEPEPFPTPRPSAPDEPSPPDPFDKLWRTLVGDNPLTRVGIVLVLLGVSFLLKAVADRGMLPPPLRLIGGGLLGAAMLVVGWRKRLTHASFALPLQGGAVGVLLLVIFAAFRIYEALPQPAAFVLMVAVVGLTGVLAHLQRSQSLAFFALVSGFAAPILLSTGHGNHVALFSYYALLDLAVFLLAWRQAWRALHLTAFLFTYAIATTWGVLAYQPENRLSCVLFLALFFLLFTGMAIGFARRHQTRYGGTVDGALVFALPLLTFSLQAAIFPDNQPALAWTAAALSAVYLSAATWLFRMRAPGLRPLVESFLAMGVLACSAAVPLALSGEWTAATWTFEGAGLIWLGRRQQRLRATLFGVLLLLGALGFGLPHWNDETARPLLNATLLNPLLLALAFGWGAWNLWRDRLRLDERGHFSWAVPLAHGLLALGLLHALIPPLLDLLNHATQESVLALNGGDASYGDERVLLSPFAEWAAGWVAFIGLALTLGVRMLCRNSGSTGSAAHPSAATSAYPDASSTRSDVHPDASVARSL